MAKKLLCFILAFVFVSGTLPLEAKAEEPEEDMMKQALYLIDEDFSKIDFLGAYTVPEVVTTEEAKAKLDEFAKKFEGKFFTVDGIYCTSSGVHATSCDNCLMSNVIAAKWVEDLVGMGTLNAGLCPTQYSYSGKQGSADGWQCFGFANFAHWYIFAGKNTDKVTSTLEATGPMNYATLKNALPGDVIRSNYYGGHSMVFISCDEEGFTVLDSNHTANSDGKSACIVKVHKVKYNSKYTVAITGVQNYDRGEKAGDINLDGKVDIEDVYYARLAAAKLIEITEQQILLGDADLDGKITATDANLIRKHVAKIIERLPVG